MPALQDRLAVFTDKEGPSDFYRSFSVDKVRLDVRELDPAKVISLVIPAERQEHQNVAKLKQLRAPEWSKLVDEVLAGEGRNRPQALLPGLGRAPARRHIPFQSGPCCSKSFQPADPLYDRPAVDCYAARPKHRLKNALDEAVAASGSQPVTVNQAVDATETFKTAAIRKLARDEQFQAGVGADRGIKWASIVLGAKASRQAIAGRM